MQSAATAKAETSSDIPLKHFKFFATRMPAASTDSADALASSSRSQRLDTIATQLNRHIADTFDRHDVSNSLLFWEKKEHVYGKLVKNAGNLLSAPTSQAYVERMFPLCGILTTSRRNRMERSLELRVFPKLNKNFA
jgi:hypothetical protein